jgi:hypothetical protein
MTLQTKQHLENSRLARRGEKPGPAPYKPKFRNVRLEQDPETGLWFVFTGASKNGLPATDIEISLWLRLQKND